MQSPWLPLGSSLLLAIFAGFLTVGCQPRQPEVTSILERGRYLVENVGMCADCHSPREPDGVFDSERWLHGAPLAFTPTAPIPWAPVAPRIAGLPGYTTEAAVRLLTEGIAVHDQPLRPPMPSYRLDPTDAHAVVLYLQSLGRD